MNTIKRSLSLSILAVAAVSCNVEPQQERVFTGDLSFDVIVENNTRRLESTDLASQSDKGDATYIIEEAVYTKSAQINDDELFAANYDSFAAEGMVNGTQAFRDTADYNSSDGLWHLRTKQYLKPEDNVEIVASAAVISPEARPTFISGITYGGQPGTTATIKYALPSSSAEQKDMLIGYYKGLVTDSFLPLKFSHPLTSLVFKAGLLPYGESLTVNSITLSDIDSSAVCNVSFAADGTTYTWSDYSGTVSYKHVFDKPVVAAEGEDILSGDASFIVIPRTFSAESKAKIIVNVTEPDSGRSYDILSSLAGKEWAPGETNVYTISWGGLNKAVLTNGPDFNAAMVDLAGGAANIKKIKFVLNSGITSDVHVEEANRRPIYLTFDEGSGTITVSTADLQISTGSSCEMMFSGLTALETIEGLDLLNTSNAVDMAHMFNSCFALKSLDLHNFNTENVEDMNFMFAFLRTLETLDLSSFKTDKVLEAMGMFRGGGRWDPVPGKVSSIKQIIFGDHFQMRNNRSFAFMFAYNNNWKNLDLSFFEATGIIDFEYMFHNCSNLESVDLSGLGDNSQTMFFAIGMFQVTKKLKTINFGPKLNLSALTPASDAANVIFESCHTSYSKEEPGDIYCNQATADWLSNAPYFNWTDGTAKFTIHVIDE